MLHVRVQRHKRVWSILLVCMLIAVGLPVASALAEVTITQYIDNSVADFTRGTFQRTSLSAYKSASQSADVRGATQLGAIGILKNWSQFASNPLPRSLYRMGAVAIGTRIYVMGGITPNGAGSTTVSDVVSAGIDPLNGNIAENWRAEPPLPLVTGSIQSSFTAPTAQANSMAVAAYPQSGGGGYIYAMGGNANIGTQSFSSFAVRVATVDSSGAVTGWRELTNARVPDPQGNNGTVLQRGVEAASATTFTVGGKTFVYLLGGLQRYFQGTGTDAQSVTRGSAAVFYAQINPANGNLYKPSSNLGTEGWEKLVNVPVNREAALTARNDAGIWDAVAFSDRYQVNNASNTDSNAIFISGGQVAPAANASAPAVFSSRVYEAFVRNDGTILWSDTAATMPAARFGHAGVTFRGNLYLSGGIPNAPNGTQPDAKILTSYVDDDYELHSFGTTDFLENEVLPVRRAFHSMVLVQAGSGSSSSAYVYVLGGRGDTSDANPGDDQGSNEVTFSRIGGDEDKSFGYPKTGWFYSKVLPINFANAEIREINWTTAITGTRPATDIQVDYRVSTANSCDSPGFSDTLNSDSTNPTNATGWRPLSGPTAPAGTRSADGTNTVGFTNVPARCLQYRAQLISPGDLLGGSASSSTPLLLNVGVKIVIPGSPDLKVNRLNVRPGKTNPAAFGGLDVAVINQNTVENTVAANAEGDGSFYVDLLVFEPGETVVSPSMPMSAADDAHSRAYANVSKSALGVNAPLTISSTSWCDNRTTSTQCVPIDLTSLITKIGTYTFVAVVDGEGCSAPFVCVNESSAGGEQNNIQAITFNEPEDPANPGQPLPPEANPLTPDSLCTSKACVLLPFISKT